MVTLSEAEEVQCSWCGNRLVNSTLTNEYIGHWPCRKAASITADLETRYGFARIRWGVMPKHFDEEWFGGSDDQ